jgi:PBP1b-binding outer membrane lipoprotein LpoB
MKTFSKFAMLLILITLIAGCSSKPTALPQSTATTGSTSPEMTTYPVPGTFVENNTYPLQAEQETPVPAYMVPGFITMTPDASLVSIIVSEVQHEDNVESIHIKNISSVTQDISSYMIY